MGHGGGGAGGGPVYGNDDMVKVSVGRGVTSRGLDGRKPVLAALATGGVRERCRIEAWPVERMWSTLR